MYALIIHSVVRDYYYVVKNSHLNLSIKLCVTLFYLQQNYLF